MEGESGLPMELCIVTDKGRNSKEQGNLVVKEAVAAMMNSWEAPFRWDHSFESIFAVVFHCQSSDTIYLHH